MPLAVRTIEPVYLGRRPLREEDKGEDIVQVAITQNAVLGALVQLASLVRHADDLFCDLADECQKVFEHTERIIHKVKRIKEGVGRLDSKKIPIPLGDLKRFSTIQDHHVSRHGFECSFFAPDVRPHCIKGLYSLCEVTPVGALRGADMYRKDGMRSSNLFKLWPVVLREHQVKTPDMNLPRKLGKAMSFNKTYKRLTPRPRTIHGTENLHIAEQAENEDGQDPASTGDGLSKSQPSILVAVDTSGTGFYRMSSFRQTLKGTVSLDRKKRRRTVSGVPDQIMREIQVFERGRRKQGGRNTPRNYSFDDTDAVSPEAEKDRSMVQYFDEMDARMEEKAQQQRASRELKLLKFLPCRRSRSLPRCVKVGGGAAGGGMEQTRGVMVFEQDEDKCKDKSQLIATAASGSNSSSLSLGSTGGSSSSSRATKRSSMIGSKIRSFVAGTLRPRPKSLDLDSIDVFGNDADNEDDSSVGSALLSATSSTTPDGKAAAASSSRLQRQQSPSMPDDISSMSSSRESKVGPGTYYYFTSSSMPRDQARKYDFPWESLPKDWTTSVKLREISKRRREERNSSSGNWSGSSNRQSLDSARSSTLPSSTSQYSLGKDSGRDSPSMADDSVREMSEQAAKECGISTFLPLSRQPSQPADTEQWLASLARRAASREDAAAAGTDVTETLSRLSQLTKQNIQALENTFSPSPHGLRRLDEELSSVYSLDGDGFYTSFHNDSGLRRSTGTLLDDDGGQFKPMKKAHSTLSVGSNNTIDSVIFRPLGESAAGGDSGTPQGSGGGKLRPPPPARCGSRLSSTSSLVEAQETLKSVGEALVAADVSTPTADSTLTINSAAPGESSQSESDQETMHARLRAKTRISSRSIPSWCLISDEESTDSSTVCLNRGDAKNILSPVRSWTGKGAIPKSSSLTDSSSTLMGCDGKEEGWDSQFNCTTLPRGYLESKVWEEDIADHYNSWPRSRRSHQAPSAGILKRDKSPAGSLKTKTLNFAPTVNMFDHHTAQGIELPLHAMSSTSSSSSVDGSGEVSSKSLASRLSSSLSARFSRFKSQGNSKRQPTITGKSGQKPENGSTGKHSLAVPPGPLKKQPSSTRSQLYAVSEVADMRGRSSGSSGRSVSSSESSLPSLSDCGQGGYLDMSAGLGHRRSQDTLSSSSSAGLSDLDVDSSLTYVSMSSANSTPTNSTLALSPEDQPTPVNSPRLQHDTYRISPVTLSSGATLPLAPRDAFSPTGGPVLHSTPELPPQAPSQASTKCRTPTGRPPFGAFADSQAASGSWAGGQPMNRKSSEDSGFSSPTTPTTVTAGLHYLHHQHHQPQSAKLTDTCNVQRADARNKGAVYSEDSRKVRTSTPPSQLSVGQRHEPLKASHSVPSPTPRPDVYWPKARDVPQLSRRGSGDGSVRPKTRTQSSAEMSASMPSASHLSLAKSLSCPTGVLTDTETVTRADSYRHAVRNTQGVVGDVATRNSSYRLATQDDDPVPDDRMDAANSWGERRASGSRDMRRMGITDIDQLKCYDSDNSSSSRASVSSATAPSSSSSSSKGFAGINSSRKKMKPEVQNLLRGDKTPSPEVKRMTKVSGKSPKDKDKAKTSSSSSSSTYIRFDPIFEHGDDMYSSTDTLRAESVELITSDEGFLMGNKVIGQLPPGRARGAGGGGGGGGGKKPVDEKAVMSILDSIKTTIRSMSGKSASASAADRDSWKYEGGL